MRKNTMRLLIYLFTSACIALAANVIVDYDHFNGFPELNVSAGDPLWTDRVQNAISAQLVAKVGPSSHPEEMLRFRRSVRPQTTRAGDLLRQRRRVDYEPIGTAASRMTPSAIAREISAGKERL
jgi:hypothetical protein